MSETLGRTVLRKVADHYGAHPEAWCTKAGSLIYVANRPDPAKVLAALNKPCKPGKGGCIHTIIRCYSIVVAGAKAWQVAENEAVKILCEHHGLEVTYESIWDHNDNSCKYAGDAITFVKAALSNVAPKSVVAAPAAITATSTPASKAYVSNEMVAALIAVVMSLGAFVNSAV